MADIAREPVSVMRRVVRTGWRWRITLVVVGALLALSGLGVANMFGFSPFQLGQADQNYYIRCINRVAQF